MDDASDVPAWPDAGAFVPFRVRVKGERKPLPPLTVSVNAKGQLSVAIGPELVASLGWPVKPPQATRLSCDFVDDALQVFLRLTAAPEGRFALRPPAMLRRDGSVGRMVVALGMSLGLSERPAAATPYREITVGAQRGLVIAITRNAPVIATAPTPAPALRPASRPPARSAAPVAALKSPPAAVAMLDGVDLDDARPIAITAAWGKYPGGARPGEDAPRAVRIAAAVAIVELGGDDAAVRRALDLDDVSLPLRADMPTKTQVCADAAVKALRVFASRRA